MPIQRLHERRRTIDIDIFQSREAEQCLIDIMSVEQVAVAEDPLGLLQNRGTDEHVMATE